MFSVTYKAVRAKFGKNLVAIRDLLKRLIEIINMKFGHSILSE